MEFWRSLEVGHIGHRPFTAAERAVETDLRNDSTDDLDRWKSQLKPLKWLVPTRIGRTSRRSRLLSNFFCVFFAAITLKIYLNWIMGGFFPPFFVKTCFFPEPSHSPASPVWWFHRPPWPCYPGTELQQPKYGAKTIQKNSDVKKWVRLSFQIFMLSIDATIITWYVFIKNHVFLSFFEIFQPVSKTPKPTVHRKPRPWSRSRRPPWTWDPPGSHGQFRSDFHGFFTGPIVLQYKYPKHLQNIYDFCFAKCWSMDVNGTFSFGENVGKSCSKHNVHGAGIATGMASKITAPLKTSPWGRHPRPHQRPLFLWFALNGPLEHLGVLNMSQFYDRILTEAFCFSPFIIVHLNCFYMFFLASTFLLFGNKPNFYS